MLMCWCCKSRCGQQSVGCACGVPASRGNTGGLCMGRRLPRSQAAAVAFLGSDCGVCQMGCGHCARAGRTLTERLHRAPPSQVVAELGRQGSCGSCLGHVRHAGLAIKLGQGQVTYSTRYEWFKSTKIATAHAHQKQQHQQEQQQHLTPPPQLPPPQHQQIVVVDRIDLLLPVLHAAGGGAGIAGAGDTAGAGVAGGGGGRARQRRGRCDAGCGCRRRRHH
eukprot:365312-Chlamydomonas_euryale.AAC.14